MGCTHSTNSATLPEQASPIKKVAVVAGPALPASKTISNTVAFGAGCYWGTEKYIKKDFQTKFPNSIANAQVGFMSPDKNPRIKHPNYEQVCSGVSGHVEVLFVTLNNPQQHFEELCRFFFTFHDPTLRDRQGNDRGFQYSSWIFCADEEQERIANKVKQELQDSINAYAVKGFDRSYVETRIGPLQEFTLAKAAHQEYLFKNPKGYCNHRIRMKQWYQVQDAK